MIDLATILYMPFGVIIVLGRRSVSLIKIINPTIAKKANQTLEEFLKGARKHHKITMKRPRLYENKVQIQESSGNRPKVQGG